MLLVVVVLLVSGDELFFAVWFGVLWGLCIDNNKARMVRSSSSSTERVCVCVSVCPCVCVSVCLCVSVSVSVCL